MRLFKDRLISNRFVKEGVLKLKWKTIFHSLLKTVKPATVVVLTSFFLLVYILPVAQSSLGIRIPENVGKYFPILRSHQDDKVQEVLNLANLIRLITDDRYAESKVLRYAGLIYHSSRQCEVNPLEIIAIIMAESGFKENSINRTTGDYGLGQINWFHWGKDYGYTPQELLDPSINIFLTCYVYKYFGQNIGKYHRGNGIQSKAYVVNVESIVSTLKAFSELNKQPPF